MRSFKKHSVLSAKGYTSSELTGRIFDGLVKGKEVEWPITDAGYIHWDYSDGKAIITNCSLYLENTDNVKSSVVAKVTIQFFGETSEVTEHIEVFRDMYDFYDVYLKYKNIDKLVNYIYETVAETIADSY